jgi:hypothetical protein
MQTKEMIVMSFRCPNCRETYDDNDEHRFPRIFKIATLLTIPFFWGPSTIVWPRNICRNCASQVSLLAIAIIALELLIVGLIVGAWVFRFASRYF